MLQEPWSGSDHIRNGRHRGGNGRGKEFWVDLRDDGAKSGRDTVKDGRTPNAGKNGKRSARQGEFISAKIPNGPNPTGVTDDK
jgi:hypothetical protein